MLRSVLLSVRLPLARIDAHLEHLADPLATLVHMAQTMLTALGAPLVSVLAPAPLFRSATINVGNHICHV